MITGVLQYAKHARDQHEKANELEQVKLAVVSAGMSGNELSTSLLESEFKNADLNGTLTEVEKGWFYFGDKNNYLITDTGIVTIKEKIYDGIIYGNEKKILPAGYQQVEYLESTGAQWINTQQDCFNRTTKVTYCAEGQAYNLGNVIIGCDYPPLSIRYHCTLYNNSYYYGANTEERYSGIADYGKIHTIIYNSKNGYLTVDNEVTDSAEFEPIQGNIIYIGRRVASNLYSKMKYYSVSIYEKDTEKLVANYIPALDDKNNPCAYDTVSGNPFYNQGTSENFKYGPKAYNCVGNKNEEGKYNIPIKLETLEGEKNMTIILDEPLRKLGDKADYLDLANKKVVRYINQEAETGDLSLLNKPVEESIVMEDIDFNIVTFIQVNTDIEASSIE